jgi:hypothetical protein
VPLSVAIERNDEFERWLLAALAGARGTA